MPAIPFFSDPAPPAVRRPRFEVRLGAAPPETWAESLVSLEVELRPAPAVGSATVLVRVPEESGAGIAGVAAALGSGLGGAVGAAAGGLGAGAGSGGPGPAVGDDAALALGYADAPPEAVFAGTVDAVRHGAAGPARVGCSDGAAALARLRLDRSYEKHTAGEVIADLAAEAGVAASGLPDGPDLPFYALDARQSAWAHVAELARRSGWLAFFDPEGTLRAEAPAAGSPAASFVYGEDLLALEVRRVRTAVGGVRVVGEGASGGAGGEAWSWLLKDPAPLTATAGDEPRRPVAAALRSAGAVRDAASALGSAVARGALAGRLLVPGTPALVPGATVTVTGNPRADLDGELLVLAVRHRLSKTDGFTTRVDFVQLAEVSALPGLAGLLGGLP